MFNEILKKGNRQDEVITLKISNQFRSLIKLQALNTQFYHLSLI